MQMLVVLVALGWLISQPVWAVLVLVCIVAAAVLCVWWLRVHRGFDATRLNHRRNDIDPAYVTALEAIVAEAEAEIEKLKAEISHLQASAANAGEACASLYRRVGLSPAAPAWLVIAAQKAYRSALHPDRHPPRFKLEAETRFKAAEAAFAEIASLSDR